MVSLEWIKVRENIRDFFLFQDKNRPKGLIVHPFNLQLWILQLQEFSWRPVSSRTFPTPFSDFLVSLSLWPPLTWKRSPSPCHPLCSGTGFFIRWPREGRPKSTKIVLENLYCLFPSLPIICPCFVLVFFFLYMLCKHSFQNKFSIKTILLVTSNNNLQAQREKILTEFPHFSLPGHLSKKRMSWWGSSCQVNPFVGAHGFCLFVCLFSTV